MRFNHEIKDLETYVNGMLKDISKEYNKDLMMLMVEYIQTSDTVYQEFIASKNYKPLSTSEEIMVYEATVEAIFNKYVKVKSGNDL